MMKFGDINNKTRNVSSRELREFTRIQFVSISVISDLFLLSLRKNLERYISSSAPQRLRTSYGRTYLLP